MKTRHVPGLTGLGVHGDSPPSVCATPLSLCVLIKSIPTFTGDSGELIKERHFSFQILSGVRVRVSPPP